MKREPSLATLKALAAAYAKIYDNLPDGDVMLPEAVSAYRSEIAPRLRTRAEVDAEIAKLVRHWSVTGYGYAIDDATIVKLDHLCAEPTAPEAETP